MNTPILIDDTKNLTDTWCQVLKHIIDESGNEISPLVITLTDFEENTNARNIIDSSLIGNKLNSIDTVAETIFPDSLYKYLGMNRDALYKTYINNLSRIHKVDQRNNKGTYFERLIAYGELSNNVNQLEIIINSLQEGTTVKRRSKLQASTFDPLKDHTEGMFQGFPCLQHVTFYKSETGGLILNSFYAVQYLYQKAYGNWLGLINLGKFVAKETNLNFERFNCFVGVEQLESKITKKQAKELLDKINEEK